MKNNHQPKITLKIFRNEKVIELITTKKRRRILPIIQAKKYKDCTFYIKIKYDIEGRWINETGDGANQKQAILAYKAFTNKDLIDEFSR